MPNYAELIVTFKLTQRQYDEFEDYIVGIEGDESLKSEMEEMKDDLGVEEGFAITFNIDFTIDTLLEFSTGLQEEALRARQLVLFLDSNKIKYEMDNDYD